MRIGIDIGGSHVGVGLIDENGKIILKKEKDLLKEHKVNIQDIIEITIINYINEIIEEQKIIKTDLKFIGIAFPASFRNGKIGSSVNLGANGEILRKNIQSKFSIPVYIRNDAKCAAICEKKYGSLRPYSDCIFLTIGTGIGGAAFVNNKLFAAPENDRFKVGHITIQKDGPKCKCGKNGCFENYASITALKRNIKEEYNIENEMTGKELYDFILKNENDKKMLDIIDKYIENLSIGISNLINLFEPEAISIGGSFVHYKEIFFEKLKSKLEENNLLYKDNIPKLFLANYKNDAGMIGASQIEEYLKAFDN